MAQDVDTEGDIYDARVGGGFPVVEPSECLSDACLSVPVAPNDPTPASSSFKGPGNPVALHPSAPKTKSTPKRCKRGKARKKGKCVKSRAKKAARRADRRKHGRAK